MWCISFAVKIITLTGAFVINGFTINDFYNDKNNVATISMQLLSGQIKNSNSFDYDILYSNNSILVFHDDSIGHDVCNNHGTCRSSTIDNNL